MKIPNKFITNAYAGACAAHQMDVHENWFEEGNFHDDFQFLYKYVKDICTNTVAELPSTLSLREIISSSPANCEFGGL